MSKVQFNKKIKKSIKSILNNSRVILEPTSDLKLFSEVFWMEGVELSRSVLKGVELIYQVYSLIHHNALNKHLLIL